MKRVLALCCLVICSFITKGQVSEIREILSQKPETEETAVWLCDTAYTFYRSNPAITEEIARIALNKANQWDSDLARAKANHVIGVSLWARDIHQEALTHYLEALKYYESIDLKRGIATINLNIGTIYDDLKQSERGVPYILNSLSMLRTIGDSVNLGRTLNNAAVIYGNMSNKQDSALLFFRECMQVRRAMKDSFGVAQVYNNIADIYLDKEASDFKKADAQEAYSNLIEGLKFLDEKEAPNLASIMYSNLGKSLLELDRPDEAKRYLDPALELAIKIESKYRQELAYNYLAEYYSDIGDFETALEHYITRVQLGEEQRNAEITKQIDQLNIKYETEKKEKQLAVLEREKVEAQADRNLILISGGSIIVVISLLLINVYSKRKRDIQIADLKMQQLNEEIDQKNREISSYTLNFIQKNQLLDVFKDQINELKKQSDTDTNKHLTRINKIVDETFRSDEEWKTFQLTFEQMHDGFFSTLKEQFPDLGNAELEALCLIAIEYESERVSKGAWNFT